MRVAAVAGAAARSCSNDAPPAGAKSRPTTRTSGNASRSGGLTAAKPSSTTSAFTEASEQDEDLLGDREPPVERHQQRAEPRAGIEQDEVVGMVGRQDRDAVAAADAELRFERARGRGNARGEAPHRSACGRETASPACRA